MAACIAWHFQRDRFRAAVPHGPLRDPHGTRRRDYLRRAARTCSASSRETSATGGAFLDELASEQEIFKIILTCRPQHTIPTALWSSSYFVFIDAL